MSASRNEVLNADQAHWSVQSPPADWATLRDRWQTAHAVRTVAAVLAFTALCLTARPPAGQRH